MFSARTNWDLTQNRLSLLVASMTTAGKAILDLTLSNPTAAGLGYPRDLLEPLADPRGLEYDPTPRGLLTAREAVCADYRRKAADIEPYQLILTASTSEAYGLLFKLLCDPGDSVLVPRPSYPLFEYLAGLESVTVEGYPLSYDGTWHVDFPALTASVHSRVRAIVAVHPNNPTGSFLHRDEVAALSRLCEARSLALISDEVFTDYSFLRPGTHLATLAGATGALTFCLGGLSKSCALPQLKLAWILVSGPEPAARAALSRLEIEADTYLSVNTPVQLAAPALLGRVDELRAPVRKRVAENLHWLEGRLAGSSATLLRPDGGWSAPLRLPATLSDEEWAVRLLEADAVRVHPGFFFDFPSGAHVVLSLLPESGVFQEGCERMLRRIASDGLVG